MATLQSLDIRRRSASTETPPQVRTATIEVAKLIDVSKCIGSKACPTQAIYFGSKEDMIVHAEHRIADLKSRGYQNAGLYDPPGVGGTHVMYVLHHADKPSLYAGLPDDPRISPMVDLWKGVLKPISLAAIAFAGVFGFFHYITKGPNEVSESDQRKGDELAGG